MRHLIRKLLLRGVLASSCTLVVGSTPLGAQDEDRLLPRHPAPMSSWADVAQRVHLPKFWIGIHGEAIDQTLRSQLKLEYGVVVRHVMEASPAAKAGIRVNDIVVSIQERPVRDVADLLGPLGESDGKPVQLTLVREGQRETLEVQPAQRPEEHEGPTGQLTPGQFGQGPFGHFPQPLRMLFLNSPIAVTSELPDNVSISISKQGKQPTKIKVTRGDDAWEVGADQLEQLPPDLRPMVASMLQTPNTVRFHAQPEWGLMGQQRPGDMLVPAPQIMPFPGPPVPGALPAPSAPTAPEHESLRREVGELKEQLEQLQKAVEKLTQPNS